MRIVACSALLALLTVPTRAAAFSDYELFSLSPLEGGGGGGRYFTGSWSDGFGCSVCHVGGITPVVQLRGLPEREYVPGMSYDVEISWLFPQIKHALNLEFVTPQGAAAGIITLPDASATEPQDRCDAEHGNMPAAALIAESAPRQVLSVNACGAQRVRFRFTAPPADQQLMFAASIVRSDDSEKPEGDGVSELNRVLYRQGFATSKAASCSLASAQERASGLIQASLCALLIALGWRRRRPLAARSRG